MFMGTFVGKWIGLISMHCSLLMIAFSVSGCDSMSWDSQTKSGRSPMEVAEHGEILPRAAPPIDTVAPLGVETATFALG